MTDMSEGIDVNKINGSRECIICHYQYFLKINFKFQPNVCNGCHDSIQKAMSFNYVAIDSVKENDQSMYFWYIDKDEAMDLFKNSDLKGRKL